MYNDCCYGNSCAYGLHTSFKTGYLISNAFLTRDVRLWTICAVYAIAYTSNLPKHGAFLKYYSKRLCISVIF